MSLVSAKTARPHFSVLPVAVRRIKMFTKYYAANFALGHPADIAVYNAPMLAAVQKLAEELFPACRL